MFKALILPLMTVQVFASPSPMTSSSQAIEPHWGMVLSSKGFTLDTRQTPWRFNLDESSKDNIEASFRTTSSEGLLTVRVDESKRARKPRAYLNGWLALYRRLGFEILGDRTFEQNGDTGYVLDLLQRDRNRQARQVLFFRNDRVVILNCHDAKESFLSTLPECNKVIRSFRWTPELSAPSS